MGPTRPALEMNTPVLINGRKYIIKNKIAEGGFSLIYDAEVASSTTASSASAYVIKEFFPAEGAYRDKHGCVRPIKEYIDNYEENYKHFKTEYYLGCKIAGLSHQAFSSIEEDNGYAVMRKQSLDFYSVSKLVNSWLSEAPLPISGNAEDSDPFFVDNNKVRYALVIIERLLDIVAVIHENACLHLDITDQNVVCAERNPSSGRNVTVYLADFGCAVETENRPYIPSKLMSYSKGFAAPEMTRIGAPLTNRTDLYSVGMLLAFICIGERAFMPLKEALDTEYEKAFHISDFIRGLNAPEMIKDELFRIIKKCIYEQYSSAIEMQNDIRVLNNSIPDHPVNSSMTKAFTLYSLKSMLEGSLGTHYSWAHEMCDRRNMTIRLAESIIEPVTILPNEKFANDYDFFQCVMPKEITNYFRGKLKVNCNISINDVLSCTYPKEWKRELSRLILSYGASGLIDRCESLMHNPTSFYKSRETLFAILEGEDDFARFYNRCNLEGKPYIGLSIITLYALLGWEHFKMMFRNDASFCASFFERHL